jgi:methyl-accepting chemotaxis protein
MEKKELSVSARLRLMALATLLLAVMLSAYTGYAFYAASLDQRLATTRNFVAQSIAIARRNADAAGSDPAAVAAAQARALAEIRALRYDGNEYMWVNDMQGRMVMHPIKPEMNGKDLSDFKDPDGRRLFSDMVDIVRKSGHGYYDYLWPKPGSAEPVSKRSYVEGFAPWGWLVGSGVWTQDVRTAALRFAAINLAVGLAGGIAMLLFVQGLARSMQRRLHEVEAALQGLAAGDLTVRLQAERADEIGALVHAVERTRDGLQTVVSQVRHATDCISSASSEIASGNLDLSQRTEETSSNLQRTASSMTQLTGTVRQSADAASQANQLAHSASEVATRGGEVVSQVVTTMNDIAQASRKIADIIGVIDGIAFQTNILALNAAVESARAGEQGRGFAVVAGEVRTLAKRSAEAAKEIKALIESSVSRVDTGSRLVCDAGATMHEIVSSVRRVSDIVGEITAAASEQSAGIGVVNQAVGQLDQMTQQNAALVEESAAAAESLKSQAQKLSEVVATFRLAPAAA